MARIAKQSRVVPAPTVRFASLEVDGVEYRLAYDYNAIVEAEAAARINLLEGMAKILLNGMDAAHLRGLLYAALRKAHSEITLDQAGDLIRIDTIEEVRMAVLRAWDASLPAGKKILGEADAAPSET
jgi:hypothetical protein